MTDNLLNFDTTLQEQDLLVNTLERVDEINALVGRETVPQGYEVDEEGVWHIQKGKTDTPVREWLSSPLWITGHTRDHKNENHGRILEFQDIDDHRHVWTMPMELLAGESSKILGALLNMGLRISSKRTCRERLLEYLAQCKPVRKARCVTQCGWFNGAFVLPSKTIGHTQGEKIIYQNSCVIEAINETSGSLDEWREQIGKMAIGNSRLILVLSAGFSGPLLKLMNHENIGIHLKGNSSLGKSTALHVGNSIWDSAASIRTYRATANGLEGIAAQHNDSLLCLDELSQVQPQEAGQVVYMLGNGMGKGRATQQGLARRSATWRVAVISSGEIGLNQLLEEIGKKSKAGQEVRLVEIPADTGTYGLFENLHGFEGGAEFATHLKNACARHYGVASRAFLDSLVEKVEENVDVIKTARGGLTQRYLSKDSSPQVIRVFEHMSLIAAAGEFATQSGITGWEIGTASNAVMKCYQDWLQARGGVGMQEEQVVLDQVKNVFQLHGESRFSPWESNTDDKTRTINRLGYRRESDGCIEFFVYKQTFLKEICKGQDPKYVEKACLKDGCLVPDEKGNPTRSERLPGHTKTGRCYRFKFTTLFETPSDGRE